MKVFALLALMGSLDVCLAIVGCDAVSTTSSQPGLTTTIVSPQQSNATAPLMSSGKYDVQAMVGDYQAQRNLAYSLVMGIEGYSKDPIMACAWRIIIVRSGHSEADASDITNEDFDCNQKLTPEQIEQAEQQATRLLAQIRKP
jgi:hypothetical protein